MWNALGARSFALSRESQIVFRSCIAWHHAETLLVWHRFVLESQITRLKTIHQVTVCINFALLSRIKLRGDSRVAQWHMVHIVLHPIGDCLLNLHIVPLCELSCDLLGKATLIFLSSERAADFARSDTLLSFLLLRDASARIKCQVCHLNELLVVIVFHTIRQ